MIRVFGARSPELLTRAAAKNETFILAKLHGTNADGACDVTLNVWMEGRQPTAQKFTGENFNVSVVPESVNNKMASLINFAATLDFSKIDMSNMIEEQLERESQKFGENPFADFDEPGSDWTSCSVHEKNCDAGELTLEHARHDHLSGSFKFQVSRQIDGSYRKEYGNVTGIINITSAQTQSDNTLLDFFSRGQQIGDFLYLPGVEKLLQGGSLFSD